MARRWIIGGLTIVCICLYVSLQQSAFLSPLEITAHVIIPVSNTSPSAKGWTHSQAARDYKFSSKSATFSATATNTPPNKIPECTEPTELHLWINSEKDDMPTSLSSGPLKDLLHLALGQTMVPIVIVDVKLLNCLKTNAQCLPDDGSSEIFLATTESRKSCFQNLIAAGAGKAFEAIEDGEPLKMVKKPFTFYISTIDLRPNYWLLPSAGSQPESAFLPFNLTTWTSNGVDILVPANISQFLRSHSSSKLLSCRRDIAKTFARDYPDWSDPSKAVITNAHILAMAHFRDLLYASGIHPVLFGGTALGWYRNCDVIPYTTDIDFGALASEWSINAQTALVNDDKLTLFWILGKPEDSLELSVCSGAMKLDLFFLYLANNKSWVGGMKVPERKKLRWTYPKPEGFCSADLRGHLFLVPCNVENFLEADYGPKWAKPFHNSKFKWYQSHYNVKETDTWPARDRDRVVQTKFYTTNGTLLQPSCW